ncbi:MAG: hypothetical protein CEE38_12525 [Planctomycetes bacterium B3_Pla]|nr:MAG: hypothetical protein CEE38_12525 [Planctomycetes bacterium B3_Pla]
MISVERALNSIRGKSVEEVREFVRNRILGTDIASFGSGHSTEPSEDAVIQLLRNPELDTEKRKAVIRGCIDVYREIWIWLDESDWIQNIDRWKDVVLNLCRVVDMAQPPELKKHAKPFIVRLLEESSCSDEILGAAVRAYMAYAQDEKSIQFWEDEILTNKDIAAYGFNALLDIDVQNPDIATKDKPKIEEHLCELWRLQVEENWAVNTAFLLRRAARVRNETALIYRVLLRLKNKDYSLWKKIEKELKQSWSQQWLAKLPEFEPPKHQRVYKKKQDSGTIGKTRSHHDLEMVLQDIESIGINFDKFYFKGTMHIDISDIYKFGSLKRIVDDSRYATKVKLEHYPKIHEEIEHASKVG